MTNDVVASIFKYIPTLDSPGLHIEFIFTITNSDINTLFFV